MSQVYDVIRTIAGLVRGEGGLQANIDTIAQAEGLPSITMSANQVITQNASPDVTERSAGGRYPCVHVYCEKAVNQLREKFRTFSGQLKMIIEARVTGDRLESLDPQLGLMVDAVTSTLDQNRGDLGAGIFYGGGYEIDFGAVKHGGRNYMQTARVIFNLDVSRK